MDYIKKICSSCRASNTYDASLSEGFCSYCGTKIKLTESVIETDFKLIMQNIENELMSSRNNTAQFKDLIRRARELYPENQDIRALFDSEIWEAEIYGCDLVSYSGKAETFTVPRCITRLRRSAFSGAKSLKACVMHEKLEFIGEKLFPVDNKNIVVQAPDSNCMAARFAAVCGYKFESDTNFGYNGAFEKIPSRLSALSSLYSLGKKHIKSHYEELADKHLTLENGRQAKSNRNLFLILMLSCFGICYFASFLTPFLFLFLIPAVVFMILTIVYDKKYQLYLTASNISRFADNDLVGWTRKFTLCLNDALRAAGYFNGYDFWNKTENELMDDELLLKRVYDYIKYVNPTPSLTYAAIQKNMFLLPHDNHTLQKSPATEFLIVLEACCSL